MLEECVNISLSGISTGQTFFMGNKWFLDVNHFLDIFESWYKIYFFMLSIRSAWLLAIKKSLFNYVSPVFKHLYYPIDFTLYLK